MSSIKFPYSKWQSPQQANLYNPIAEFGEALPPPTEDFLAQEGVVFDIIVQEDGVSRILIVKG